jgi:dephospho-CoA kinase
MVRVIGLTGQSGAGKTTVSSVFKESGYAVINADEISRKVVEPGSACLKELSEYFGTRIILPDGTLNRSLLADIAFSDKSEQKKLNAIIYPYINEILCAHIKQIKETGYKFILYDAPTLFESKADDLCDLIISVTAKEDIRKKRVMERDNLTEDSLNRRFGIQHTENFFIKHSDFVIKNNKTLEELIEKTREVADKIKFHYELKQIS